VKRLQLGNDGIYHGQRNTMHFSGFQNSQCCELLERFIQWLGHICLPIGQQKGFFVPSGPELQPYISVI
jgi:hypothetical protein